MFWFDKNCPDAIFMDNRTFDEVLCNGQHFEVNPDVLGDFRNIPFPDNSFNLVVFDPPHLLYASSKSWLNKKYGSLDKNHWREDLKLGFNECWRVLKDYGVLCFKWSEPQVKFAEVAKLFPSSPLFGSKRGKQYWVLFMKGGVYPRQNGRT